jgi:hypothetical protein
VEVGVFVDVGVGVSVGPRNWPASQADKIKHVASESVNSLAEVYFFIPVSPSLNGFAQWIALSLYYHLKVVGFYSRIAELNSVFICTELDSFTVNE